eukprot:scaffold456429_cov34-Prasinocladus_malaysianus.AAC.1
MVDDCLLPIVKARQGLYGVVEAHAQARVSTGAVCSFYTALLLLREGVRTYETYRESDSRTGKTAASASPSRVTAC